MLKIQIPKGTEEIKQQIKALERIMRTDNDKDREIHQEALNTLKRALKENGDKE